MEKQRLFALDLNRCFALFLVVSYHFCDAALLSGASQSSFLITCHVWGFDIGDTAVSLFFILSGAALMLSGEQKLQVLPFYKRRFQSLYPLFWLSWLAAFTVRAVLTSGQVFDANTPAGNLLFTVAGLDGMLAFLPNFYLLGEWFLGVIVLLYLIYPLLHRFFLHMPVLCWTSCMILYFGCLWLSHSLPFDKVRIILPMHIPELLFGMTWSRYLRKFDPVLALAGLFVLGAAGLLQASVPRILIGSLTGASLFIALCNLAALFLKTGFEPPLRFVVSTVAQYSYAAYLVHHYLIDEILSRLSLQNAGTLSILLLYLSVMILIGASTYAIYHLHLTLAVLLKKRVAASIRRM